MNYEMMEGKVVLVTGGSRGIGRQIVLEAAKRGARVAFCARNMRESVQALLGETNELYGEGKVIFIQADISREAEVKTFFNKALAAFDRIDIVINNAAISQAELLVTLSTKIWDQVLATNLTGAFFVARHAIKEFTTQKRHGRIITIGSVTQNGAPSNVSYAVSKGGLVGLTRTIAREYGDQNIYAYLVVGGYAKTDLIKPLSETLSEQVINLTPQRRIASPKEIAAVVLFLATSAATPLNGQAIYASGGLIDPPPYTS